MRFVTGIGALGAAACLMLPCLLLPVAAVSAEMRGVTKTEIRIGQTMPYSGPVSAFGALRGDSARQQRPDAGDGHAAPKPDGPQANGRKMRPFLNSIS